ncbi:MAG TPA: hypothetical protein VGS19_06510 [Streptosporangiaceae bacterium]|nr:hypothetical protein [Streptosporangiaceae bacterium]
MSEKRESQDQEITVDVLGEATGGSTYASASTFGTATTPLTLGTGATAGSG